MGGMDPNANRYGAPSGPPQIPSQQSAMAAPGLPQAAQEATSGPQAPPTPYSRQGLPDKTQQMRRNVPDVS